MLGITVVITEAFFVSTFSRQGHIEKAHPPPIRLQPQSSWGSMLLDAGYVNISLLMPEWDLCFAVAPHEKISLNRHAA
jgi:hypothetical protein